MKFLDSEKLKFSLEHRAITDIDNGNILGAAIFVQQEERVVYNRGIGIANPEREINVTNRTLFRLASMTKPVSAVAAMLLVE